MVKQKKNFSFVLYSKFYKRHEGEKITQGFKYIVRSDIMFRRLNGNLLKDKDKFKKDPNFIKAMKLYDESILLQKQGNPSLSTKKYLVIHLTLSFNQP